MKININHAVKFPQVPANVKYIFIHNAWGKASAYSTSQNDKTAKGFNNGNANFYVDDKSIWESVPAGITSWHMGVYKYNQQSIGIEICRDRVSKAVYDKSEANAIELAAYFCKKYKLKPENAIKLHSDYYATSCPATSKKYYKSYNNVRNTFIKKVKAKMNPKSYKIGIAEMMGKSGRRVWFEIMPWDIYYAYTIGKLNNIDQFAHPVKVVTSKARNIYDCETNDYVGEFKPNSGIRWVYINTALEKKMKKDKKTR